MCYFSGSGNTKFMFMQYFDLAVLLSAIDFSFNVGSLSAICQSWKEHALLWVLNLYYGIILTDILGPVLSQACT